MGWFAVGANFMCFLDKSFQNRNMKRFDSVHSIEFIQLYFIGAL